MNRIQVPCFFRAIGIALLCGAALLAEEPATTTIIPASELPASLPWDLATLSQPPAVEWLDETSPVRSLLYAGEPFQGHATRVFAYYATPASIGGGVDPGEAAAATTKGPWPGVVLVHGGALAIEWTQANVPAILDAHYPGELGGDVRSEGGDARESPSSTTYRAHSGRPSRRSSSATCLPRAARSRRRTPRTSSTRAT